MYAILAAVLYSLMTPVSKLLLLSVPPVAEAGPLYLGAGYGMTVIYLIRKERHIKPLQSPVDREDIKYAAAMITPDMLSPFFCCLVFPYPLLKVFSS